MKGLSLAELLRNLSKDEMGILSRDFLNTFLELSSEENIDELPLEKILKKMKFKAYVLDKVMPTILEHYLLPNKIVNIRDNNIKIDNRGKNLYQKIIDPGLTGEEVMNIIISDLAVDNDKDIRKLLQQLIIEIQENNRPRIFVDLVCEKPNILDLMIRNSGGSPAYDIKCIFDPDLPYHETTLSNLPTLNNLSFLEHGHEIRFFYQNYLNIVDNRKFPKKSNVIIKYKDSRKQSFIESYIIGLDKFKNIMMLDRYDINDIHKDLQDIRKKIDDLQRRGILIKTTEDIKKEQEKYKKFLTKESTTIKD